MQKLTSFKIGCQGHGYFVLGNKPVTVHRTFYNMPLNALVRINKRQKQIFVFVKKLNVRRKMLSGLGLKPQGDMYRCCAKCSDDATSMEGLSRCTERCSVPYTKVQNILANEMERFETRLNRCAHECQDRAQDKAQGASGSQLDAVRSDMEKCVVKCADTSIALLPEMYKRLSSQIKDLQS